MLRKEDGNQRKNHGGTEKRQYGVSSGNSVYIKFFLPEIHSQLFLQCTQQIDIWLCAGRCFKWGYASYLGSQLSLWQQASFFSWINVIINCHMKSDTATDTIVRPSNPSHLRFLGGRNHQWEPWQSVFLQIKAGNSRMRVLTRNNFSLRQPISN